MSELLLTKFPELRNKVYGYVFDDGKASNLNLLQTCRKARIEAGVIGFGSITYFVGNSYLTDSYIDQVLNAIPLAYRNAITSVVYRDIAPKWSHQHRNTDFDHSRITSICHSHGIFPVEALHIKPSMKFGSNHMRFLAGAADSCSYGVRNNALFGQWLDNPRLRSWTLRARMPYNEAAAIEIDEYDIVALRENEDGTAITDSLKPRLPHTLSDRMLAGGPWLRGIQSKVLNNEILENDHFDTVDEFTLVIKQATSDEGTVSDHVRVRFILYE